MLTLNDGRRELWQWDTNRKLTVDAECSQVHFSNKVFGRSIDVDVVDGVAIIPDILLQTDKELSAWAFVGTPENGYTKISKVFKVNKRNKPADYVFTPTDQTTLGEILNRIEDLENRPSVDVSEEDIQNAVNDYLDKNPVSVDEKDPTVPAWAKQPEKPKYTAAEVGALPADTPIPEGIPIPPSAQVGQTIVVKAVDENGKPTEWECADFPSGGLKTHLETIVDYTFDGTTTLSTAEGLSEYILWNGKKAVWNKDNSGNLLKAIRLWGFVHCTQATTAEKGTNIFVLCGCANASTYADIPSSWWYGDDVGSGDGTYALTDTYILKNVTVSQGMASGGWCDHSLGVGVINTAVGSPNWRSNLKASVPPKVTLDKVSPNYYKDYIYAATLSVESGSYIVPQGVRIVVVAEVIDE